MNIRGSAIAALGLVAALALSGCTGQDAPPEQEPATVVMTVEELQGAEVELAVGATLGVDTGENNAVLYDAMILDGSIAAYEPSADGSEIRIEGVGAGTTDVLLGDPDGTVDEVSFTLTVTP